MQLAKSIMLKSPGLCSKVFLSAFLFSAFSVSAQDNSPYSRYGLGDLMQGGNTTSRGMGGVSAGYADIISVNFNNPASYSQFLSVIEQKSKEVAYGRVILDVGLNFNNRSLIEPNTTNRFTSADALFSHLQVGLPIKKNWGISFGIRPISRISYNINRHERLFDPVTLLPIDSAITQFQGSGGAYLPTVGTGVGFTVGKKESSALRTTSTLSLGANFGYLFGSRENIIYRNLINDSVLYYSSNHTTKTSFGDIYLDYGTQYQVERYNKIKNRTTVVRLGLSGNLEQKLSASQDMLRQTFAKGSSGEDLQIDSVFEEKNHKGQIIYPGSYKAGFIVQNNNNKDNSGWMFGADFNKGNWNNYRFFGQRDSVQNSWTVNVGGQIFPKAKSNYFSHVIYRFGFYTGRDYIKVNNNLPLFGASFGMGLPIGNYSRLSQTQFTVVNVGLEYGKRGNNNDMLKENMFRVSIGLNFTDLWFGKKKYE